jgi:cold shock CspA family protein
MTGVVKRAIRNQGFGFITADSGEDYFFHESDAPDFHRIQERDRVTFVGERTSKGLRARTVALPE